MRASNEPRDGDVRPLDGRHLSEDELNRYIDDDLASGVRRQVADHLAHCDHCRNVLAELQILTSLLRDLPLTEVPRSFQLDPKHAARREPVWRRWGATLLPLLPAMRAATLALAVAFGGVTAYRVVDDQPASRQVQEQSSGISEQPTYTIPVAAQSTVAAIPTSTQPAPADATFKTTNDRDQSVNAAAEPASDRSAADEAAAGAAAPAGGADEAPPGEVTSSDDQIGESDQSQPSISEETADSVSGGSDAPAAEENTAMIAMDAGSPAASPTATSSPTHTPTATVVPTDTPAATPTELPAVTTTESDDQSWLGWAQAALGMLLAALGALVIALTRLRRGVS